MGIIIAKFRKKTTTYEVLDKLENEIQSIEEFRRNTELAQKRMVARFIFISVLVYLITAVVLYFYFFPASASERILYIIPLIITPILLVLLKRILSWYYNRKIVKNQKKLTTLKDEKKKLLEDVMDKETYKVAQKILEKFAPEQIKKSLVSTPMRPMTPGAMSASGVRYRGPSARLSIADQQTPAIRAIAATPAANKGALVARRMSPGTPLLMPRSVLPRDRSVLDKMVDYLVGDGPSNRYALICKNCSSHNGMAIKEEFEYLSFKCCYCGCFNPARKQRPWRPKLENSMIESGGKVDSESEKESDSSDDDNVDAPVISEVSENEIGAKKSEPEPSAAQEEQVVAEDKVENMETSEISKED